LARDVVDVVRGLATGGLELPTEEEREGIFHVIFYPEFSFFPFLSFPFYGMGVICYSPQAGLNFPDLVESIPPRFNQLLVFDGRIPPQRTAHYSHLKN